MNVIQTALPDLLILEPKVFGDARGFFMESFNARTFREATGLDVEFVQDNHSLSAEAGVIRGLHFQTPPFAQDKLVRVVRGRILDVTDKSYTVELTGDSDKLDAFIAAIEPGVILETVRTGASGIGRGERILKI